MLLRPGCCWLPIAIALLPFVLVFATLWAVFKGSPGQCGGGRAIDADPALAIAYQARWAAFNQRLLSGLPASITVTEDEATARSRLFLALQDAPVNDVRVCFSDGEGDVNGTISTPFGPDVAVRIKGTVDLTKASPDAKITSMRIGAVPRFVTRPFEGLVSRIVEDQTEQIVLFNDMDVEVRDGEATITGQP